MKHSNISIFVPHIGCPNMCSFCDQRTISGEQQAPGADQVRRICSEALANAKSPETGEIAFFGGSFTAIKRDYMTELLEAAKDFVGKGGFHGIRVSTRPDCVDREVLSLLKDYGVTAVELGAQSMSDKVLAANNRGHSAEDVVRAAKLVREQGFELGLQMMTGLYMSSLEDDSFSFERIMALRPDTLRIYPVVILKGTALGKLFLNGSYRPADMDSMIGLCAGFLERAQEQGVRVIKCGLHASESVEKDMLGGFYHPAFRELCEGRLYRNKFDAALKDGYSYGKFSVPAKELSKALGQKRCNVAYFAGKGIAVEVVGDKTQTEKVRIIERR